MSFTKVERKVPVRGPRAAGKPYISLATAKGNSNVINARAYLYTWMVNSVGLKLGDRVDWLVDHDRKLIAIKLGDPGEASITSGDADKKGKRKVRISIFRELSDTIRTLWGLDAVKNVRVNVSLASENGMIIMSKDSVEYK